MTPEYKDEKKINMEANLNKQPLHNMQPNMFEKCLLNLDICFDEKYQIKAIIFATALGVSLSILLFWATFTERISNDSSKLIQGLAYIFIFIFIEYRHVANRKDFSSSGWEKLKKTYSCGSRKNYLPVYRQEKWCRSRLKLFWICLVMPFFLSFIVAFSISNLVIYFLTY